ncbi:MAG: hypothetical protein HC809_11775 [Gammaproteobacteria bacterium]|nr:hypothetical protein [Gammaproteobacteria bacterium]
MQAAFKGGIEDGDAGCFVALTTEGHGAQAECRYLEAIATQSSVFHSHPLAQKLGRIPRAVQGGLWG